MSSSTVRQPPQEKTAQSVNFEELLETIDEQFAAAPRNLIQRFSFELDGIQVEMRRVSQTEGNRFLISMTLGHLPFSLESVSRRNAIMQIIDSARSLPHVRFHIDYAGKVMVGGLLDIVKLEFPDFIFYPLILFLQEARPFMRLIGQYMSPTNAA